MEGFDEFIKLHESQLISSGVPENLWLALHIKIRGEVFDAGEVFQLLKIDYDEDEDGESDEEKESGDQEKESSNNVNTSNGIYRGPVYALMTREQLVPSDATAIFLIDHAWTFRLKNARAQLQQNSTLLERMCNMLGIEDVTTVDQGISLVMQNIWRYCHTYSLLANAQTNDEDRLPIWYIMDEVGSAVNHSNEPNSRIVPFYNCQNGITYSLLFPKITIEANELVTRDLVENIPLSDELTRKALLLPWQYDDFTTEDFLQTEPSADYFTSGHVMETYHVQEHAIDQLQVSRPLKVYTEYEVIANALTSADFTITDSCEEADILWLTTHFKEFSRLATESPHKFINQFPFEYVITIKDLLAIVGRRCVPYSHNKKTLESLPHWLPTTYNLKTELVQFLSYYQERAKRHLDNHWIIKPYNLARAIDQRITKDLNEIVRLSTTGPKIIQKYIDQPVLFYREDIKQHVKFDIRYVIMIKNVNPLEAYIHREFFLRFANHEYSLTDFDDYEKHFTVMNYRENAATDLYHLKAEDFLKNHWPQQYPQYEWEHVEADILNMLYSVLECASKVPPPCGIPANAQSRSMYAADIMLEWEHDELGKCKRMQPKLLEINWTPDCKRACDYYPDFFNDIFKLLFLNENNDQVFKAITHKYVCNGGSHVNLKENQF